MNETQSNAAQNDIQLDCVDEEMIEGLPDGNALGTTFCASTNSSASCPASSASTVSTASSAG